MSSNRKQKMITGIRHNKLINFFNSVIEGHNEVMGEISLGINPIWAILIVILFFIFGV